MAATETERPTKELVQDLTTEASTLIRKELALAQLELKEKGKRAGIGGGLFGAAGLVALLGLGALVACAILALATAVDAWLAALIVAVVLFAAAGIAALVGRTQVKQATPPEPTEAIASSKRDINAVQTGIREGQHS